MPKYCDLQTRIFITFSLSLAVFISILFSLKIVTVDLTISDFSSIYHEHARKFKEPYPPMIFGAYEDNKRISVSIAALKPIGYTVYCRYFDGNGTELHSSTKSFVYPLFVVFCDKVSTEIERIAITDGPNGEVLEQFRANITRRTALPQFSLTHCSPPLFGKEPKWLHLVEMIEHYKLEGVQKFYIYIREVDPYDRKLLNHYARMDEVQLIEVPPIYTDAVSQQLLAIADCHLRNRLSSNWTIFSDFDERMIMTDSAETLGEFLNESLSEQYGAVMFAQRWIFKYRKLPEKFINYQQIMEEMPTRKWELTTQPGTNCTGGKHCWAKMIINNKKVLQMLVHDVGEYEQGYKEFILDPDVGYIRHYRDVEMSNWKRKNENLLQTLKPFENTTYSHHLRDKLLNNVLLTLHQVYGIES